MVKIVWMICIALLLAGCTGYQQRSISRSLGIHKVARVFPVDLSSREKQVFRIMGLEKPSLLGRRFDGLIQIKMNLCVDSIPGVSIEDFRNLKVDLNISMDDFNDNQAFGKVGSSPRSCWWANNSDGIHLATTYLPSDTDFNKPMIIEFQIKNSYGWTLVAKSHKPNSSGISPLLEYEVVNGDTLALSKFKNPRLIVWIGE